MREISVQEVMLHVIEPAQRGALQVLGGSRWSFSIRLDRERVARRPCRGFRIFRRPVTRDLQEPRPRDRAFGVLGEPINRRKGRPAGHICQLFESLPSSVLGVIPLIRRKDLTARPRAILVDAQCMKSDIHEAFERREMEGRRLKFRAVEQHNYYVKSGGWANSAEQRSQLTLNEPAWCSRSVALRCATTIAIAVPGSVLK